MAGVPCGGPVRSLVLLASGLLVAIAFAGCGGNPNYAAPDRDLRRDWERERDAHGPMGIPATFDVTTPTSGPLHITGTGRSASLVAPLDFVLGDIFPSNKKYLYFEAATVTGQGSGLLVVSAVDLHASQGTIETPLVRQVSAEESLHLSTAPTFGARPSPVTFPEAWRDANESFFFADRIGSRVSNLKLQLDAGEEAILIKSTGTVSLNGTITLEAPVFYWSSGSFFRVEEASLMMDRFALGGNVTGGSLKPTDRAVVNAPKGIFGRDADIDVEPGRAKTTGSFRLTQAMTSSGLLLGAQVEVKSSESTVSVGRGQSKWVSVSYREKSYVGDAVLKDVQVTGNGKSLVKVPLKPPPTLIDELWDLVFEEPWAGVFIAIPLAIVTPFVVIAQAITCAFTVCPENFPYPIWIDAGDVNVFYFKVVGGDDSGRFDSTITLTGQNYAAVTIPLTIQVT